MTYMIDYQSENNFSLQQLLNYSISVDSHNLSVPSVQEAKLWRRLTELNRAVTSWL